MRKQKNGHDGREFTSEWIEVPPEKRPVIRGGWRVGKVRDLDKDRKMFWWVIIGTGVLLIYMFIVGVLAVMS